MPPPGFPGPARNESSMRATSWIHLHQQFSDRFWEKTSPGLSPFPFSFIKLMVDSQTACPILHPLTYSIPAVRKNATGTVGVYSPVHIGENRQKINYPPGPWDRIHHDRGSLWCGLLGPHPKTQARGGVALELASKDNCWGKSSTGPLFSLPSVCLSVCLPG